MIIVTDTCSILMLLRLNPAMFRDSCYECCTTQEVFDEIFQTRKFKDKYSWRDTYRGVIKPIPQGNVINATQYKNVSAAVNISLQEHSCYNLSREDKSVVILSLLLPDIQPNVSDVAISTTDRALIAFSQEEFDLENIEPLEIVNIWLEKGAFIFDHVTHMPIFEDWIAKGEPFPSPAAKRRFKQLTGYDFPK